MQYVVRYCTIIDIHSNMGSAKGSLADLHTAVLAPKKCDLSRAQHAPRTASDRNRV